MFVNDNSADTKSYITILLAVFLIIVSYSFDYYLIVDTNPIGFKYGFNHDSTFLKIWSSFYYSSMIFFWMGIADITANCFASQFVTWSESMVTFLILSYGTFKFLKN